MSTTGHPRSRIEREGRSRPAPRPTPRGASGFQAAVTGMARLARTAAVASVLVVAGAAWGTESVVPQLDLDVCLDPAMPVGVYTSFIDLEALGDRIRDLNDLDLIQHHMYLFEAKPVAIFVDLLQAPRGANYVQIEIADSAGRVTWMDVVEVPLAADNRAGLVRNVLMARIPEYSVRAAFPHADVYSVAATAEPLFVDGKPCGSRASTTLIVVPDWGM